MRMILESASNPAPGLWLAKIPPHQVAVLGAPKATAGSRSVLLVQKVEYEKSSASLTVDVDDLIVLNHGTTAEAILVSTSVLHTTSSPHAGAVAGPTSIYGSGDRDFFSLVHDRLRGEALEVARSLLEKIRSLNPGDLKRGLRLNFSNTPDNFWYVVVQPREQALSITVRGAVSRFRASKLDLKDDRPGYTRFKVAKHDDVEEALKIIAASQRR